MVDNVFNTRYGLFGAFFNQEAAGKAGEAMDFRTNFFGT